jgi:hypothetical protein
MGEWLTAPIGERKVRIVMIDGKVFQDHGAGNGHLGAPRQRPTQPDPSASR